MEKLTNIATSPYQILVSAILSIPLIALVPNLPSVALPFSSITLPLVIFLAYYLSNLKPKTRTLDCNFDNEKKEILKQKLISLFLAAIFSIIVFQLIGEAE